MTKTNQSVKPVDPASLRGLSSHAETHWLTFATALKCFAQCPTQPQMRRVADRHGPSWLRGALRQPPLPRANERPPELDPKTGTLAFLTRGAEQALKSPPPNPAERDTDNVRSISEDHRLRMERYLALAAARADITRRFG